VRESVREPVGLGTLDRLYARFGTHYVALVLGWLEFLALAGGMLSAVVASRLLDRSFRPPLDLVLMVEGAIAVGCGVPFVFLWREARRLPTGSATVVLRTPRLRHGRRV